MPARLLYVSLVAFLLFGQALCADDQSKDGAQPKDIEQQLAEIDVQAKQRPDDPMLHYARAKLLAALAKYDDAYAAAQTAMEKFIAAKKDLAWLSLDSFEAGGHKVTVHFNMGPDERSPPETGIVRPLSFRIYAKDGASIIDAIDFEIGYFNGKRLTAAFGQTTDAGHANLGAAKPDLPYSKIRAAAIELIAGRVKDR